MGMVESIENNTKNINAPKKRGRKPKNKINEHKIPKKRGRKPKEVKDINNNVNLFDSADIKDSIIHLKTNSNNINDNLAFDSILKYNPNILDSVPVPYDPDFNNIDYETLDTNNNKIKDNFNLVNNDIKNSENGKNNIKRYNETNNIIKRYNETTNVSVLNYNIQKKNISPIMVYFNEYNKRQEWPKSSNIKCLWCCYNFESIPCAIPYSLMDKKFYVFGNFCSPECAASYNFDSKDNDKDIWERYSLLNYLYSIIFELPELTIKLAAPRLSLNVFGGKLSIEEFRQCNTNNYKNYKIVFPPMVSIIASLEEVKKDSIIKNNYVPINKENIKKINNDLRLKREKPISNKNTLENCMRLKYV